MPSFAASNAAYEATLAATFGDALVTDDLADKHRKMRKSGFAFLRGTCFRWAQGAARLCPQFTGCAPVGGVGDAHVGNFGLWRDARARLVWGVNDFDEAAMLPWPLDLVRLAASALLAAERMSAGEVADEIAKGYRQGLDRAVPCVLERQWLWLRDAFLAADDAREAFWAELEQAPSAEPRSPLLGAPLMQALTGADRVRISARSAGVGSLGRPRFAGLGEWRGGPLAVEVKGRMPSCFGGRAPSDLAERLSHGATRAPEPTLRHADGFVIRRLAPDSRKLEFADLGDRLMGKLLRAMGEDVGAAHAGLGDARAVGAEFDKLPGEWLASAAERVAGWTRDEWRAYRDAG